MTIVYHEDARTELKDAVCYYRDISWRLVSEFEAEFQGVLEKMRLNPQHFHFTKDKAFRRANMRQFPYRILYDVIEDQQLIRIVVFCHSRRHPSHGLDRK